MFYLFIYMITTKIQTNKIGPFDYIGISMSTCFNLFYCYNKIPETGKFIKNKNVFLTEWRLEIAGTGIGEDCSLYAHGRRAEALEAKWILKHPL